MTAESVLREERPVNGEGGEALETASLSVSLEENKLLISLLSSALTAGHHTCMFLFFIRRLSKLRSYRCKQWQVARQKNN